MDFGGGPHDQVQVSALAGDYIFVGYYKRMTVRVYRKSDLSFVGTINIGKQACAPIYTANGTPMLRWLSQVTAAPAAPDKFTVIATGSGVQLSWTPARSAANAISTPRPRLAPVINHVFILSLLARGKY